MKLSAESHMPADTESDAVTLIQSPPPVIFEDERDPREIRVRGGDAGGDKAPTNPEKLAKSILHVLRQFDHVRVLTVGPKAMHIAMRAYRIAKSEVAMLTDGIILVCTQSEYTTLINENSTTGVCTRIFPIPIKFAL